MRQKDIGRIAVILEREMRFADESEVEGLKVAIGAIKKDVGWAQPELDMSPLDEALAVEPLRQPQPKPWEPRWPIHGRD